jgi:hypothetical protein
VKEQSDEGASAIIAGEDVDYHLIVSYVTTTAGPPHKVVVRDNIRGWVDVPMTAVEADGKTTWSADLTTTQGPAQVEFKLVLDGQHWMAGSNRSGTTATPETTLKLDDFSVEWES